MSASGPPGRQYEKYVAKRRGARHLGGPGNPDFVESGLLTNYNGEVKDWSRRMNARDVEKEVRKGRDIIVSKKGYTRDAIEYAHRHPSVQLETHGKRVAGSRFALLVKKLFD